MTFFPSFGSLGISSSSSAPRSSSARPSALSASSRKKAAISGSDSAASICLASAAWAEHLPVLAIRRDDLLEFGEGAAKIPHALLVVGHVGSRQLGGDRFVAGFDLRESIVEWSGHASIIADGAERSPAAAAMNG